MVFSRCLTYGDQFLFRFELQLHMYIYILLIHGFMIFVWTMFIWFWWGSDIIIYISIWSWGIYPNISVYFSVEFIHTWCHISISEGTSRAPSGTSCGHSVHFFPSEAGWFFWMMVKPNHWIIFFWILEWFGMMVPDPSVADGFFQKFEALPVDVGWALEICDIKESERKGSFFKYFAILLWVEKTWCVFFWEFFSIFGDSSGNCAVFFPDFNLYQKPKDLTVTNDAGHCPEELARQMGQHHLLPLFLGAADMVTLLEKIAGERVNQHFFILRIVVTVVVNFKQLLGCPRTGQQWEN